LVTLSNLRGTLNKSFTDYQNYIADKDKKENNIQSEYDADYSRFSSKKSPKKSYTKESGEKKPHVSFSDQIEKFNKDLDGVIVLVEGKFVVTIDTHQLKHNPNLSGYFGITYKGGKGSILYGGIEAHKKKHAPAVLEFVKEYMKKPVMGLPTDDKAVVLSKERVGEIEAYIILSKQGDNIIVCYHGNYPN
jgi:hypothetical protein